MLSRRIGRIDRVVVMISMAIVSLAMPMTAARQQQPAFRAGVDLMSTDVVVLDKRGAPVASLTAADFTVTLGKKPRRIVSAEFVRSARPDRVQALRSAPGASSNRHAIAPRTLIFLIDTEQIPSGGGRVAIKGIGEYLDKLGPDDRVGVMTLTESRVPPTTNRAPVREVVDRMVGTSARLRDRDMTFGEASGVMSRDRNALLAYWSRIGDQGNAMATDRTCGPPRDVQAVAVVPAVCVSQAEVVIERARFESRRVVQRLVAIADAMATIPDPKAVVLVSGGLYSDDKLRDALGDFAAVAERARVVLSAIFVEPDASAGGASNSDTRRFDSQVGFGGLVDIATVARGSAHRVVSTSEPALARVDRELSGYYVVSFERDAADTAGARLELEVRSTRADVSVAARKVMTPGRPITAPAPDAATPDPKAGIAALLKTSLAISQVPVSIDAYALPATATTDDARVILAIEVARDPGDVAALGFQIADSGGKVLGDGYEAPPKLLAIAPGRSGFVTAIAATAGRFVVRVGTIDAAGQRGGLQHSFEVRRWPQAPIRLSDLMFGASASGEFVPGAGPSADGRMAMRLIVRDNSSAFTSVRVRLVIARATDDAPIDEVEIPLVATPDPLRRFADASIRPASYDPGEYIATMVVTAQGKEVGRSQRAFTR